MTENWFAIRTKSNRETAVSEALSGKGYEVLYPRHRAGRMEYRNGNDGSLKALFPGYLFCRFDVLMRLPILTIPGVLNIVSTGRNPTPIDESELQSIKVLLGSNLPLSPHAYFKMGDKVMISDGPLTGAKGYVAQTDKKRLIVSITLLQRSISVEVSGCWLEKLSGRHEATGFVRVAHATANHY